LAAPFIELRLKTLTNLFFQSFSLTFESTLSPSSMILRSLYSYHWTKEVLARPIRSSQSFAGALSLKGYSSAAALARRT
jgi:hypothetical protein